MKKNKKIQEAIRQAEMTDYDEDGNAIIAIGLNKKEEFYDPFCDKTYKMLNRDMLEFIEHSAKQQPPQDSLAIEITCEEEISDNEKNQMSDAIKRQFAEELIENKRKLVKNLVSSLILAIVGLGVLAICLFLEYINSFEVIYRTIDIAAWVFLWEAFDVFFLRRPEKAMKYRLVNRLLNSKVSIIVNKSTIKKKKKEKTEN